MRQAEVRLAAGAKVSETASELGTNEVTFRRWKARYGGMSSSEPKRLRELEKENARLKTFLAEKELDINILTEVSRGNL